MLDTTGASNFIDAKDFYTLQVGYGSEDYFTGWIYSLDFILGQAYTLQDLFTYFSTCRKPGYWFDLAFCNDLCSIEGESL